MYKKVWNGISAVLLSLMVVLAVLLAGVRLVGIRPYAVTSGSMVPVYPVGSLLYVRSAEARDVAVGDPITFYLDGDTVATHRVIGIDAENGCFYTKGDANASADGSPVPFDALIGMPVFCLPVLGYFSYVITRPPGLYIALCAAAVLVLATFIPSGAKEKKEQEKTGWRKAAKRSTP